ncbi:MAG TPA: hypothetical protein PKI66_06235 [Methanobacteriaceae archaeon]|jgi:hypothetical protein|nr:hypothetical protein [Euryarchaeota archaeon]HNR26291.1 hypothetical protein [Methanobacteriaceae archaeon]HNS25865.1 hypothetical protein [Methanobacteriaceae archaeon]
MPGTTDPLTSLNFIFCIIILIMGYWGFRKYEEPLLFYIGMAFGLFGVSHLALISGYPSNLWVLILIRTVAYLLVIFALFQAIRR